MKPESHMNNKRSRFDYDCDLAFAEATSVSETREALEASYLQQHKGSSSK